MGLISKPISSDSIGNIQHTRRNYADRAYIWKIGQKLMQLTRIILIIKPARTSSPTAPRLRKMVNSDTYLDMAGLRPLVIPPVENPTHPSSKKLRGTLPLEVDWRTENKVSSVKNQGSCGSCWAFTSTALYESILMI